MKIDINRSEAELLIELLERESGDAIATGLSEHLRQMFGMTPRPAGGGA